MTSSPTASIVLDLYQRIVSADLVEQLQQGQLQQPKAKSRRGIYSARVVLWLMMLQRLHAGASLATAVQLLIHGAAEPLLERCRRVIKRCISPNTGGFSRARQQLPSLLCRQVNLQIVEQLRRELAGPESTGKRQVFLLDGSSLELEHCPELVSKYPSARNQHGRGHWPVLRIVVLHDVQAGLAQPPCWGPMYGAEAVSEQDLGEQAMSSLPAEAVVLGDRNFGVLWVAHAAQQRRLNVVLRLTEARARKLVPTLDQPGDWPVVWSASRWDGGKHRRVPPEAAVSGRLVAARIGRGKSKQWLYLFTTLDVDSKVLVEMYGQRWNIETDLRALKRTVQLHHIRAKSEDMMEKEILMATAAYNLVRAVMLLAARQSGVDPRRLSFTQVLNVVNCAWPNLMNATDQEEQNRQFQEMLALAARCKLPKRTKRRSYPRRLWRRPPGFGFRKEEK
jgi:hypothetical protein